MADRLSLYGALDKPRTIRLLCLDATRRDNTLAVSLRIKSLDDAPPYYALSYRWGLPEPSEVILCDGVRLRVTVNLAQAIRRLQRLSQSQGDSKQWGCDMVPEWFWIDQICINQQDLAERSSQVQLMEDIYKNSVKTLIWLGPVEGSSHLAWGLVDQIYDVFRSENPDATHMADIKTRLYSTALHEKYGLPDWEDARWGHFWKILQAPWFRRVWVIQEVALSPQDPLIMHGDITYPWDRLGWASTWLRRAGFVRLSQVPSQLLTVDTISNLRRSHVRWTLPAILMATSGKFLATDPRDKLFGLRGLILESEQEALDPDYTKDVAKVYQHVTKFLIRKYRCLAILDRTVARLDPASWPAWSAWPAWSQRHPVAITAAVVPSWVPNWSLLTEPSQPRYLSWATYHGGQGGAELGFPANYKAAAGLPAEILPAEMDDSDSEPQVLQLRGLMVDTVDTTSSAAHPFTLLLQDDFHSTRRKLFHFPLRAYFEGTTLLGRLILILASLFIRPLFLKYWNLAMRACEGFEPIDLIDAFIKCTTADHFSISGSSPEEIRRNGCAYLLTQLKAVEERKGIFSSVHRPFSSSKLTKQAPYLEALRIHGAGGEPTAYASLARNYCLNRRFFVTTDKRLGIGPKWTQKGDLVCVLFGGGVPYVIRPKAGGHFEFIGESYVYGLMDGQAVDAWRKGQLKEELFRFN